MLSIARWYALTSCGGTSCECKGRGSLNGYHRRWGPRVHTDRRRCVYLCQGFWRRACHTMLKARVVAMQQL